MAQQFEFYEVISQLRETNVERGGYRYTFDRDAKITGRN